MPKHALDGIRIIDVTLHQVGPLATALLADLGAEVIKVEEPERGDLLRSNTTHDGKPLPRPGGRQINFEAHNRNKKGIAIDLARPEGKDIIYKLARVSDVLVTNFRVGALRKLAIDYNTIRQHNPQIIYARASGFGDRGPLSNLPSADAVMQARSGLQMACGEVGGPPVWLPGGFTDAVTAVHLSHSVLAALLARQKHGTGQEVVVSMLGATLLMQQFRLTIGPLLGMGPEYPRRQPGRPPSALSCHYRCKDGKWLALAFLIQDTPYWHPFCEAIGRPDLESSPLFQTTALRIENCLELKSILESIFVTKTRGEWLQIFDPYELLIGPANEMSELFDDPQVLANGYIRDWVHPVMGRVKFVGSPWTFSETPPKDPEPAPEIGEHTVAILSELLGYESADIESLRQEKVIRVR